MNKSRIPLILMMFLVWLALTGLRPLPQQTTMPSPDQVLAPAAPASFGKLSPTDGKTDVPTNSVVLRWSASSTGVTYQYCLRPNLNQQKPCPPKKWISVGANTSVVLQGLTPGKDYYWQVRAVDSSGQVTYANGDIKSFWKFSTVLIPNLPGAFGKITPIDPSYDQPINDLVLTWNQSIGATSYQYCYDTRNNNLCDTAWLSASGLTATLNGLAYGTTYYWQVRAVNTAGSVQADLGDWFSFQTVPTPGGAFGKTDPTNGVTEQPVELTLTWGLSEGTNITYEYCLSTSPCTTSSTWTPSGTAGTDLSVDITGLQYATTYYWQVRAKNAGGTIYADDGTVWHFTTQVPPAAFGKSSPGNGAQDQPLSLILTWDASTGASRYEYCFSETTWTPCSSWLLTDTNTSTTVSGLDYDKTYYWQVRAVNAAGMTEANNGEAWHFKTQAAPPEAFGKDGPSTGTQGVPINPTLQWKASTGAAEYFYCIDTVSHAVGDSSCPAWVSVGSATEFTLSNLDYSQTYYWQVRANNTTGNTLADNGIWWSFTTIDAAPQNFTKMSPTDGAVDQSLTPWLYWWTPTNTNTTYQYCINTTNSCPDSAWQPITENTPIQITTPLSNNATRYYWQVRAYSGGTYTYANADTTPTGAWWSFTTLQAPPTSSDRTFNTPEDTPFNGTLTANSNYPEKIFSLYGSLPAGMLDFHSDGSFTYTPVSNFSGVVTFQFTVSDGHNPPSNPYTVTITVIVNPADDPPVLSPIPDQVGERGKGLTFYAQATDPDLPYGDYLTYSIDETLPWGATIDPITGLFSWLVPSNQANGVFTFTMRVIDSSGHSATQPVKITINSVNNPPVLSPMDGLVGERGKELTFNVLASDPDGDILTYSIDEVLPDGATIDPATGLFSWLIPANQGGGVYNFTVRVTDNGGLSATQPVKITISYMLMLPLITR